MLHHLLLCYTLPHYVVLLQVGEMVQCVGTQSCPDFGRVLGADMSSGSCLRSNLGRKGAASTGGVYMPQAHSLTCGLASAIVVPSHSVTARPLWLDTCC